MAAENTDVDAPADEGGADGQLAVAEGEQVEEWDEDWVIMSNSMGDFDGERFYLRSFPVWYRWTSWQFQQWVLQFSHDKPESGRVDGVEFEQTMGRTGWAV